MSEKFFTELARIAPYVNVTEALALYRTAREDMVPNGFTARSGRTIPLNVLNTFSRDQKITAIKAYRLSSPGSMSLREAKDDVDDYWNEKGWTNRYV